MILLNVYYEIFSLIRNLLEKKQVEFDLSLLSEDERNRVLDIVDGVIYSSCAKVTCLKPDEEHQNVYKLYMSDVNGEATQNYKEQFEEVKYILEDVSEVYDFIDLMKESKEIICDLSQLSVASRVRAFDLISGASTFSQYEMKQLGDLVISCYRV